jgi:hypothetical protein
MRCTGPQKPRNLGVKGTAKNSKNGQKSTCPVYIKFTSNVRIWRVHWGLIVFNASRSPKIGLLALKRIFYPNLACSGCIKHCNAANQPFMIRFWLDLVHRLNLTSWIQKTHHRRSDAIFRDGCRRHVENRLSATERAIVGRFWWTSVYRRENTCLVRKAEMCSLRPKAANIKCKNGKALLTQML